MPPARHPEPPDRRTLVDRVLDRVKNNPVAAVVVVACLGIGALASLTDSVRKLRDLGASFGHIELAGEWKSEAAAFRPYGDEFLRLTLKDAAGGQVVGDLQFSGNERLPPRQLPILEGRREGKTVTLAFESGEGARETLIGDVAGPSLHLVLHRPGAGAVVATARPTPQAPQLVGGRLDILYKGKPYADPRAACTQLLQDLDPPQAYRQSDPPDEQGSVHCVGSGGFDMFQNDVQQMRVCPAQARVTLVAGQRPALAQACECDGDRLASGGACVPR